MLLVSLFIPNVRGAIRTPFDLLGFLLCGVGLLGVVASFESIGRVELPLSVVLASVAVGAAFLGAYVLHARRAPHPLVDLALLVLPTFRAGVIGGSLFRIGIGAVPFLLPMLLQLGFGLSAFNSGMLTFAAAAGAMTMKVTAAPIIRRFGFRRVLIGNALLSACFLAAIGLFRPETPHFIILAILLVGGFFRSLEFTCINVVAYADVDEARMSRATSFASMAQQLCAQHRRRGGRPSAAPDRGGARGSPPWGGRLPAGLHRRPALISAASVLLFVRLPADAGAEMSGHRALTRRR